MVTCGYVRTSREDQHPENQINIMIERGVPRQNIFVDAGVSGAIPPEEREGYSNLMRFLEENDVDHLYVFEISRLGRSFTDTLSRVIGLEETGIMVWSLSPSESWTRIEDRKIRELMLAIFTWVADRERENLIERTKAGQNRARAEGKHCGRPYREINWKKIDEYRDMGLTLSAISRLMDVPYSTLLRRYKERLTK